MSALKLTNTSQRRANLANGHGDEDASAHSEEMELDILGVC